MPCITELYSLFYKENVKVIPDNIYDLLTPVALAHMIMGDGSIQPQGLILCTDSYSLEDVVRLINVLILKYTLDCTIRVNNKNQYCIYITQSCMALLANIVSPYMHSSMLYKIKSALNTPRFSYKIEVLDVKNNVTIIYSSMSEAAKKLDIPQPIIVNYFKRNQVKPYKNTNSPKYRLVVKVVFIYLYEKKSG